MGTRSRIAAAMTAIVLLAAGCSGAGGSSSGGDGGFLRVGGTNPIDSLNPFVGQADYSYLAWAYTYPHLIQINTDTRTAPDFATRWEATPNGLTWTFHTRPGAKWSDGRPLTAEDAAWTISITVKFGNGPTAQMSGYVAHVTQARATDPNTLVVTYDKPVANALDKLSGLPILPRQVWGPLAAGDGTKLKTFANNAPAVAGGPFILQKHVRNQVAIFDRNPNWYGRRPHIRGFGLQFFSNSDAMIQAAEQGNIDVTGEATPPTAAGTLRRAGLNVVAAPSLGFKSFIINANPNKHNHRELLNPQVREAMADAVDRNQIVKVAWLGYATPGDSIVAPVLKNWHDQSLKPETFDPAAANRLLDAAGYRKGGDGIRTADGHRMSYTVVFTTEQNGTGDRAFQIIQSGFRQIGIEITQRKVDLNAATQEITSPNNKYLDFDMAMSDWFPTRDPDFILNVLTCDQYGGWNDSGFCNKDYDNLYQAQITTLDRAHRRQVVDRAQEMVYRLRPYIVLVYPDNIEARSRKWTGFVMAPLMGSITNMSTETLLSVHLVG